MDNFRKNENYQRTMKYIEDEQLAIVKLKETRYWPCKNFTRCARVGSELLDCIKCGKKRETWGPSCVGDKRMNEPPKSDNPKPFGRPIRLPLVQKQKPVQSTKAPPGTGDQKSVRTMKQPSQVGSRGPLATMHEPLRTGVQDSDEEPEEALRSDDEDSEEETDKALPAEAQDPVRRIDDRAQHLAKYSFLFPDI